MPRVRPAGSASTSEAHALTVWSRSTEPDGQSISRRVVEHLGKARYRRSRAPTASRTRTYRVVLATSSAADLAKESIESSGRPDGDGVTGSRFVGPARGFDEAAGDEIGEGGGVVRGLDRSELGRRATTDRHDDAVPRPRPADHRRQIGPQLPNSDGLHRHRVPRCTQPTSLGGAGENWGATLCRDVASLGA